MVPCMESAINHFVPVLPYAYATLNCSYWRKMFVLVPLANVMSILISNYLAIGQWDNGGPSTEGSDTNEILRQDSESWHDSKITGLIPEIPKDSCLPWPY